jgi:hypothetical protein
MSHSRNVSAGIKTPTTGSTTVASNSWASPDNAAVRPTAPPGPIVKMDLARPSFEGKETSIVPSLTKKMPRLGDPNRWITVPAGSRVR